MIMEKVRAWKCNKIFLATEDKNIIQFFKNTFVDGLGEFFVILDREYVDHKPGQQVATVRINREDDYFLQGKEYLTEMVLLSLCTSFVTVQCSGSTGVMMLAENFENTFAFNLGTYGVKPVDWKTLVPRCFL